MAVHLRPTRLDSCTGYYNAYGSQLLKVTRDKSGLLLDDGGGLNNEFMPLSDTRFIVEEADWGFNVSRNVQGDVPSALLRLGKDEMVVQRIGPLARTVTPRSDPDMALTEKIETVLKAFAQGGQAVQNAPQLAPQARKDYSSGPTWELTGMQSIAYLSTQDVATKGIERHGARVSRVLYYKLLTNREVRFVLVYLTTDGLVTDQDVVTV